MEDQDPAPQNAITGIGRAKKDQRKLPSKEEFEDFHISSQESRSKPK